VSWARGEQDGGRGHRIGVLRTRLRNDFEVVLLQLKDHASERLEEGSLVENSQRRAGVVSVDLEMTTKQVWPNKHTAHLTARYSRSVVL
jgi:hypothetical protein